MTEYPIRLAPVALVLRITGLPLILAVMDSANVAFSPHGETAPMAVGFALPVESRLRVCVTAELSSSEESAEGRHDLAHARRDSGELSIAVYHGVLPLAEFVLGDLACSADFQMAQSSVAGVPVENALREGIADMRLRLSCATFNEEVHHWEPAIAPWRCKLTWRCSEGALIEIDDAPEVSHLIEISSVEPLEVDVTHAMLTMALRSLATAARTDDVESHSGTAAAIGRQRCALCNTTELPVRVLSSGAFDEPLEHPLSALAVRAGETIAFATPASPWASSFGSPAPARTVNCPELVAAARAGDMPTVRELLYRGAPVDSVDRKGRSALHIAIRRHMLPLTQLLVDRHADLELPSGPTGMHPLHVAAQRSLAAETTALLVAGADPLATNAKGQVPAALAKPRSPTQLQLYMAMQKSIAKEIGGNTRFSSVRLVRAAGAARVDKMRTILESRADPNSFDGHLTALHACVENVAWRDHSLEAATILLQMGAAPDLTFAAVGHGRTALARAAKGGRGRLVELLLEKHADPTHMDDLGLLPIDLCPARTPRRIAAAEHSQEEELERLASLRSKQAVHERLRRALFATVSRKGWLDIISSDSSESNGTARPRYVLLLPGGWLACYKDASLDKPCERIRLTGNVLALSTSSTDDCVVQLECIQHGSMLLKAADSQTRDEWMKALVDTPIMTHQQQSQNPTFSRRIRKKNKTSGFRARPRFDASGLPDDHDAGSAKSEGTVVELTITVGEGGDSSGAFQPIACPCISDPLFWCSPALLPSLPLMQRPASV
jgi:ankyrin repeat protein